MTAVGKASFNTLSMTQKGISVHRWPACHALDSEEAIDFAQQQNVKVTIEKGPVTKVQEDLDHMISSDIRFRAILTTD